MTPREAEPKPMNPPSSTDPLDPIRRAAAGLVYPSESDAAVEPFAWPASAGATAKAAVAAKQKPGTPIEEVSADDFFAELDGTSDAAGFRTLRQALDAAVAGLTVLRAGEVRVSIYVVGRLPAKAAIGELFTVAATVFREGHDAVGAQAVLTDPDGRSRTVPLRPIPPAGFDRWENWRAIAATVPMAIYARPGSTLRATRSPAAAALHHARLPERDAARLADMPPPAWIYLRGVMSGASSTALRRARARINAAE